MASNPLVEAKADSGNVWDEITSNATVLSGRNETDLIDFDCILRSADEEDPENFFHFLLYGILLNVIGLLGLAGNIISITVLSRPNMRCSINCCLIGLASMDIIVLTTSLLMFGLLTISEYAESFVWYQRDVFPWVVLIAYPLGVTAQTGSIYLTFTVTVERYVAVCHPLKARSLCTHGRARMYVLVVALFSVMYNLPRFWEITYKECHVGDLEYTTVVMTDLRKNETYITIYIMWLYLFVMYLIPFISLLVFNFFIYKQVRLANHERQRLSRLQKKELSLAVMLLVVVVVFFICNILAFIANVLEIINHTIPQVTIISNFLVTVNSSVNFIIYCIFGQKFRRLFLNMFCGIFFLGSRAPSDMRADSIMVGNSVYEQRPLANGRNSTLSMRVSSWNGPHSTRIVQPQNGALWQGRKRGSFTTEENIKYDTIPLTENTTPQSTLRSPLITPARTPSITVTPTKSKD